MSAGDSNVNGVPAAAPAAAEVRYNFPLSEIPKNPLGEGKFIKTAGCLIIGYVSGRLRTSCECRADDVRPAETRS